MQKLARKFLAVSSVGLVVVAIGASNAATASAGIIPPATGTSGQRYMIITLMEALASEDFTQATIDANGLAAEGWDPQPPYTGQTVLAPPPPTGPTEPGGTGCSHLAVFSCGI